MPASNAAAPVLELRDVSKSFGPVVALRSGSLRVEAGSIHALVGENGAGKSTLVKVVAGVHRRDSGTFELGGEPVDFSSTAESKKSGVAVIYQEPTLFPDLSVTENIFMGRQILASGRRIDRAAMYAEAERLFDRLGVRIDPRRPAEGLSIADQQIIEIAKAISLDARLLVMDEPTAALSGVEVDRLFAVARSLRDEGRALVFISHRFDEVFDLADTVTVMRDGSYIDTKTIAETTPSELVSLMVGRDVDDLFPKVAAEIGEPVLQVRGLSRAGVFHDIDLEVRAGEIVGLAGLVGAGRSEVARAVFGVDSYDSGSVSVSGRPVKAKAPRSAIRAGMAFIPEDRRKQGLVIDSSVTRNVAGVIRRSIAKAGLLTSSMENRAAGPWAGRLEVKTSALDMTAATMSGGNQQKVVIAKWLATDPKLLIIDEPTRGIDVGTKAEVHRLLSELAGQGLAILMISSELPEVLGMADRVVVLCEGRITAELDRADATPEAVMHAATHHLEDRPMSHTDVERPDSGHGSDGPPRCPPSEALLVEPSRLSPTRRALTTVLRSRELSIFLVLVAVVVLATTKNNGFLFSSDGWRNFLLNPSILVLLAVGQAVVIITRNVDLSVGSVMALTAYLTGRLFIEQPNIPIVAVLAACLLLGAVLGLVNGVLVAYGGVPALVITLGTLYIYRGIMLTWAGQRPDQRRRPAPRVPPARHPLGARRARCSRSSRSWSWRSSATTSTPPAVVASSTRSAPTRTPRSSTDCPYVAACSRRSS